MRQVSCRLEFHGMDYIRANFPDEPLKLILPVIRGCPPEEVARDIDAKVRDQGDAPVSQITVQFLLSGGIEGMVDGHIFQIRVNKAVVIAREEMHIPSLIRNLCYPPSGVDAVGHGDEENFHRRSPFQSVMV
jgi:hypothetical protein